MCSREVARKQSSTWAMMSHLKTYHKDIDLTRYPSGNQQTDGIPLLLICLLCHQIFIVWQKLNQDYVFKSDLIDDKIVM